MILEYDATFEGFLSAVFDVYLYKYKQAEIIKKGYPNTNLFMETTFVITDEKKQKRIENYLISIIKRSGLNELWKAYLSEDPQIELFLLKTIQEIIDKKKDILNDYAHPIILQINQLIKKVGREKHRMEAFVRFQLLQDGWYYARIEPDFNVLPLIEPHFTRRYADQRWIIYDTKRHYGLLYDLHETTCIEWIEEKENKSLLTSVLDEKENAYQELWQDYFTYANIKERKNNKVHLQHVPKRYWRYLTEKKQF